MYNGSVKVQVIHYDEKAAPESQESERRIPPGKNHCRLPAEKPFRKSENTFGNRSEDAPVGICIIKDERFRYIDPKMVEIFGHEVEELVESTDFQEKYSSF